MTDTTKRAAAIAGLVLLALTMGILSANWLVVWQ